MNIRDLKYKPILRWLGAIVVIALIGVAIAMTNRAVDKMVISDIRICFSDDNGKFVDEDNLRAQILASFDSIIGSRPESVDCSAIERFVIADKRVAKAEVFQNISIDSTDFIAHIQVEVEPRDAVLRAHLPGNRFYIDRDGVIFPWSKEYIPNLPVIMGAVAGDETLKQLGQFGVFLENSDYWRSIIDIIDVDVNGNLTLHLTIGKPTIIFGKADEIPEKFRNIEAMFQSVMPKVGWNRYSEINVMYRGQVVAK